MATAPKTPKPDFKSNRVVLHRFTANYKQQGVALLTILLLVVAITVLAGAMVASQRLSIRQYELLRTQDQILQDIRAAEQMATALIIADSRVNDNDSMQDVWASDVAPISHGNQDIAISIKDASARFNLNNLYHDGAADESAIAVFKRLLNSAGLEANLAYAVLDWQDTDNETSPEGGAESDAYNNQSGGFTDSTVNKKTATLATISNQPFISVDELMSVKGFTPESFRKLQPYITAVPYYLPINVNTADSVVLSALSKNLTVEQLESFTKQVQTTPATSMDNVLQQTPWSTLDEKQLEKVKPLLAVNSQAFDVLIDVSVEDKHRYATSMISKTSKQSADANQQPTNAQPSSQPPSPQFMETESDDWQIAAFGTRLWSYRPNF